MSKTSILTWNLVILGLKALKESGLISYPWKRGEPISLEQCQSALTLPVSGRIAGTATVTPYENLADRASLKILGDGFQVSCVLYRAGGMFGITNERLSKRGKFEQLPSDLIALTQTNLSMELIY